MVCAHGGQNQGLNLWRLLAAATSPSFPLSFLTELLFCLGQRCALLFKHNTTALSIISLSPNATGLVAVGRGSLMHIQPEQGVSLMPHHGSCPALLFVHTETAELGGSLSFCDVPASDAGSSVSLVSPCPTFPPGKLLLILQDPARMFPEKARSMCSFLCSSGSAQGLPCKNHPTYTAGPCSHI